MRWATTTFRVSQPGPELMAALEAWKTHIQKAHPQIKEVRCATTDAGTKVMWQEGFEDFRAYQELVEAGDENCAAVMAMVFKHAVPGSQRSRIWNDAI